MTAAPSLVEHTTSTLLGTGGGAVMDVSGEYRYRLWRSWDSERPLMLMVMLNPSTADHEADDNTVRRCLAFARREGCGSLEVVNLFALRSSEPAALYGHPDPVGPANDEVIAEAAARCDTLVAAWGAHGRLQGRSGAVRRLLRAVGKPVWCLRVTKGGEPGHPLYVPAKAPLVTLQG